MMLGHPDFVEPWRSITDETACRETSKGILLNLWSGALDGKLPNATEPYQAGDIAVVKMEGEETGAIFTGDRWYIRSSKRRHFIGANIVTVRKAWSPCQKP